MPLVPFLASELEDAQYLYSLYTNGETESLDGLELLLLGSPLLRVWENVRAAVYCLEGGVTLSKAMATGTQIMTAAARLRYVSCQRGDYRATALLTAFALCLSVVLRRLQRGSSPTASSPVRTSCRTTLQVRCRSPETPSASSLAGHATWWRVPH